MVVARWDPNKGGDREWTETERWSENLKNIATFSGNQINKDFRFYVKDFERNYLTLLDSYKTGMYSSNNNSHRHSYFISKNSVTAATGIPPC